MSEPLDTFNCYIKEFDSFDVWKIFQRRIQRGKIQVKYFKICQDFNFRIAKSQMMTHAGDSNKYNLQFKKKRDNDGYMIGEMSIFPYSKLDSEIVKFWIEKQISMTIGMVGIVSSLLFEVKNNKFAETLESIKDQDELIPSKIFVYFNSQKESHIKDFLFQSGSHGSQNIQVSFLKDVAKEILHLGDKRITGLNSMLAQVDGLTKRLILDEIIPKLDRFMYTIKNDGMRTLLIITNSQDDQIIYKFQSGKQDIFTIDPQAKYTVIDGEEYEDTYYIWDILIDEGRDVMNKSYRERLEILKKAKLPKCCKKKEFKEIKHLTDLSIAFERYSEDGLRIDGAIINDMDKSYQQTVAYKLKDMKYLTNDFLVEFVKAKDLDTEQRTLLDYQNGDAVYKLYVGGKQEDFKYINHHIASSQEMYQPMLFAVPFFKVQQSEFMKIDDKMLEYISKTYDKDQEICEVAQRARAGGFNKCILECAYDKQWRPYPIRFREDKTSAYKSGQSIFGNNFDTALSNLNNIMDPIDKEFLEHPVDDSYFNKQTVDRKYDYFREKGREIRVAAFKKAYSLIDKHHNDYINALDIGAGRNSDYYLYLQYNFNTVILYEPDVIANIEYYKRMINQINTSRGRKMPLTYIVSQVMGFDVIDKLKYYKISMFCCNYTLHYFCDSDQHMQDFKNFILQFAQKGAIIQFTYNDGKKWYDLLEKYDGTYSNGKYYLKLHMDQKRKKFPAFQEFGQKIDVLLGTISEFMTLEWLVNIEAIKEIFEPEIKYLKDERYEFVEQITEKQQELMEENNYITFFDGVSKSDKEYMAALTTSYFRVI